MTKQIMKRSCKGCAAFDELAEHCAIGYEIRKLIIYDKKRRRYRPGWEPQELCPKPLRRYQIRKMMEDMKNDVDNE